MGLILTIICISNNALSEYEFEGRVRSRIGSSEIFFERYNKSEVIQILSAIAKQAFSDKIDDSVLESCAEINAIEHGDARRAIDLLRKAAEIAARKGETISKSHVDEASDELQNDRIIKIVSSATRNFRMVCFALARISYLTGESWHSTSTIYRQYWNLVSDKTKLLGYRSISEILTEIKDVGIVISETASNGRRGWGTRYKLTMPPEMLGSIILSEIWEKVVANKKKYDKFYKSPVYKHPGDGNTVWENWQFDVGWKNFVQGKDPEWKKPRKTRS
jgi:cell division control protein 6